MADLAYLWQRWHFWHCCCCNWSCPSSERCTLQSVYDLQVSVNTRVLVAVVGEW